VRNAPSAFSASAKASALRRAAAASLCETTNTTRPASAVPRRAITCSTSVSRSVAGSIARRLDCSGTPRAK